MNYDARTHLTIFMYYGYPTQFSILKLGEIENTVKSNKIVIKL